MKTILEKFEEIKKAELALELLKKEYNGMWEDAFPKPDYGVTKTPTYISRKYLDLYNMFGDDYGIPKISTCTSCGLVMSGAMGYVCNRGKCPTGLGGAFC